MATPVGTDDEFEHWPPTVADPIRESIGQLLVAIIESTSEGSPERAKAMGEALAVHERIRDALRSKLRLN